LLAAQQFERAVETIVHLHLAYSGRRVMCYSPARRTEGAISRPLRR
jgi:hypothetical protein